MGGLGSSLLASYLAITVVVESHWDLDWKEKVRSLSGSDRLRPLGLGRGLKNTRQTNRHTNRKTDRLFSLVIKTKFFIMSTGCQNVSQTDRKIYRAPGRQTELLRDRMTVWQNSRAAKEPALVDILNNFCWLPCSPITISPHLMSMGGEGVQKYFSAFQLSYQNKTCSEC